MQGSQNLAHVKRLHLILEYEDGTPAFIMPMLTTFNMFYSTRTVLKGIFQYSIKNGALFTAFSQIEDVIAQTETGNVLLISQEGSLFILQSIAASRKPRNSPQLYTSLGI